METSDAGGNFTNSHLAYEVSSLLFGNALINGHMV